MEAIAKFLSLENILSISTIFLFIIGQIEGQVEKKNSNTYTLPA